MRDEETGSVWQQVTGRCVFGPLRGQALELAGADELTFGLWKQEAPTGTVLAPVSAYADKYAKKDWDERMARYPTVLSFDPLPARELVLGLSVGGADRAFPLKSVMEQAPIMDSVGATPVLLVVGPDGKSVRAFIRRVEPSGEATEFHKKTGEPWALLDSATGSEWNFQGCAVTGPAQGKCLEQLPLLKDYWFDWRNHHPQTAVYRH
jgi:hypothetical protein